MMVISDFCSDIFCIYNCHSSFFTWLVFSSKCIKIQKSEKCEKWLQKVKICNCTKCVNLHNTSKDNLFCLRCENSLHCKCTRISPKDFSKYKKGKKKFIYQFCTACTCINCDMHVQHGQKGVLCNVCNLWIHQKCAEITKAQCQNIGNSREEPWYYRPCKANMGLFIA